MTYVNVAATAAVANNKNNVVKMSVSDSNDDLTDNSGHFPTPPPPSTQLQLQQQSPNRFQAQDLRLSTSPLSTTTESRSSNSPLSPFNDNELLIINEDNDNNNVNDNSYDNKIYLSLHDLDEGETSMTTPSMVVPNRVKPSPPPPTHHNGDYERLQQGGNMTILDSLKLNVNEQTRASTSERTSFGFVYNPETDTMQPPNRSSRLSDNDRKSKQDSVVLTDSTIRAQSGEIKRRSVENDHTQLNLRNSAPTPVEPTPTIKSEQTQNTNKRKSDVILDTETGESVKQQSKSDSPTKSVTTITNGGGNSPNEIEVNKLNTEISTKLQIDPSTSPSKNGGEVKEDTSHQHQHHHQNDNVDCLYCKIKRTNSVKERRSEVDSVKLRSRLEEEHKQQAELVTKHHHHQDTNCENCVYCKLRDNGGKKLTKSESLNIQRPHSTNAALYTIPPLPSTTTTNDSIQIDLTNGTTTKEQQQQQSSTEQHQEVPSETKDQIRIENRQTVKSPSSDDILKPKYNQINTNFRQDQEDQQREQPLQHNKIPTQPKPINANSPHPLARSKSIASPTSNNYIISNTINSDSPQHQQQQQQLKFNIKKTKPIYQLIEKQTQQSNNQHQSANSDDNISNDENLSSSSKENIDDLINNKDLIGTSKRKCSINLDELKRRKSEDEQQHNHNHHHSYQTTINRPTTIQPFGGTSLPTSIESTILKFNVNNTNSNASSTSKANKKSQSLQDTTQRFNSLRCTPTHQHQDNDNSVKEQHQQQKKPLNKSASSSSSSSQEILNNEINNVKNKVKLMELKATTPTALTASLDFSDNSSTPQQFLQTNPQSVSLPPAQSAPIATTVIQLQQPTVMTAAKPTSLLNAYKPTTTTTTTVKQQMPELIQSKSAQPNFKTQSSSISHQHQHHLHQCQQDN